MAFDSSFTRRDTAEGVVFAVKPAAQSPGALLVLCLLSLLAFYMISKLPGMILLLGPMFGLFWGVVLWDGRRRKAVTIRASRSELRVGDTGYPASEIVEFQVKSRQGAEDQGFDVHEDRVRTGQRAWDQRSYSLMMRRRSSSKPVKVVYGLQYDTARALMTDLIGALR